MAVQPMIVFDDNGITVPTKSQIFNYLIALKKEIYGQDIIIQEGTPEYSEVDYMANQLTELNNGLKSLYDSISPSMASGVMLDNIVALNGIVRISEVRSTADVTLTGTEGTVITNGVVRDVNNNLWNLPSSVTIGSGGIVTVTATCQTSGDVSALANTITIIQTQVTGWTSVTNPNPASIGSNVETDSQLRFRRTQSVSISSITPTESLVASILQLEDVSDAILFENDTASPVALKGGVDNLPAKSICLVVNGGDQTEIGETLRLKKTLGCGTFGDTEVELTDSIGQTVSYFFERPDNLNIYVAITIQELTGYASTTDDLIKQALVDVLKDLSIAEDVTLGTLLNAVFSADPLSDGLRTFNITILNFGTTTSPTTNTTVEVDYNKIAFTDEDFSKITLSKV